MKIALDALMIECSKFVMRFDCMSALATACVVMQDNCSPRSLCWAALGQAAANDGQSALAQTKSPLACR